MSLSPDASWLHPPNFLQAMEGGAGLALKARATDLEERSTADRLQLAYDQLAQNERHQAMALQQQLELKKEADDLRRQDLLEQKDYHESTIDRYANDLGERTRHNTAMEGKNVLAGPEIVTGPDGKQYVKVSPNTFRPVTHPMETLKYDETIPGTPEIPEKREGGFLGFGSHVVSAAVPEIPSRVVHHTRRVPVGEDLGASDLLTQPSAGISPFTEGQTVRNKKTGAVAVWRGGRLVPLSGASEQSDAIDETDSGEEDQ